MDSFLSNLGEDGDRQSEGVFTIDPSKARLKLSQYRLEKFQSFVRFLLAGAASSGCADFSVRISPRSLTKRKPRTIMSFLDWHLTEEELYRVALGELGAGAKPEHHYLVVALSTISSRYRLAIQCGRQRIYLSPDGMDVKQSDDETPNLSISVVADLAELLESRFRKLARWSPVSLSLDGRHFPQGIHTSKGFRNSLGLYWIQSDSRLPVVLAPQHQDCTVVDEGRQTYPQILAFSNPAEVNRFGFYILKDGLSFSAHHQLDLPFICGAVVADHLQLDISNAGLVENEDYLAVLNQVRVSVTILLEAILNLNRAIDPDQELRFHQLLSKLANDFDVTNLNEMLHQQLERMQPHSGLNEVASLKLRLPQSSLAEQLTLFEAYQQTSKRLRHQGLMNDVSGYLRAEIELRKVAGVDYQPQRTLLSLSNLCLWNAKQRDYTTLLGEYVEQLKLWVRTGRLEMLSDRCQTIHPTWYLAQIISGEEEEPFALAGRVTDGELPYWIEFLRRLTHERPKAAIKFARGRTEFKFYESRKHWNRLFWITTKGKLSWTALVALRVNLTRYNLEKNHEDIWNRLSHTFSSNKPEDAEDTLTEESLRVIKREYFRVSFWPKFLALWYLSKNYPEQRRALVAALIAQLLLGRLMAGEEVESTMERPLDWDRLV